MWRSSRPQLPVNQQGLTIQGTPLRHPHFVSAQLQRTIQNHRTLGRCCATVLRLGPTTSCVLFGQISMENVQHRTTKAHVSVLARFWVFSSADTSTITRDKDQRLNIWCVCMCVGGRQGCPPKSQQPGTQPGRCPVCLRFRVAKLAYSGPQPRHPLRDPQEHSQVLPAAGGSVRRASARNWHSVAECCRSSLIMRGHSCVHRVAQELESRSLSLRRATTLTSTHSFSRILLLRRPHLPLSSLREGGECFVGVVSQWRVRLPGSAAKQEVVSQPMSWSATLILAAPNARDPRRLEVAQRTHIPRACCHQTPGPSGGRDKPRTGWWSEEPQTFLLSQGQRPCERSNSADETPS